jgi:RNA polymerase sigma-70 factor (ECF subfamily)
MHAVPVAEAAALLGVPEGTIKSRCFRGRATLATMLTRSGEARAPMEPAPPA